MVARKKSLYEKIDKSLAGGFLPGGSAIPGTKAELQQEHADLLAGRTVLPTPTPTPTTGTPNANVPAGTVETFTNEKTGRASGAVLPNGKTFLGISPEDVNKLAQGEASRVARPENSAPVGTAQTALNTQLRNKQLLEMAQQGLLTPQELQSITGAEIDIGQALGAGAVGVLPGALGGAATGIAAGILGGTVAGAAGGSVVPGLGTAIGAGIGAIGGFLVAIRSNIKGQQVGEFSADQAALSKGQTMLRSLITDTNRNPQNTAENIALFYQTLNMIDAAHAKTWKDSQENLNKFLGNDGTPELAKFEVFDAAMRQYYINAFEMSLLQPDQNKILLSEEDLLFFENE